MATRAAAEVASLRDSPSPVIRTVDLCGVDIHALSEDQLIRRVLDELDAGRGGWIVTVNLDILRKLGIGDEKVLVVIAERGENLYKSFRNLRRVHVIEARELNAEHVLNHDILVFDRRAIDQINGRVARDA